MRGLVPFITKWLQGSFDKDCSVVKANEFFVKDAYNSLVESLYDLVSNGVAARQVFNPATPGVSGRISTLNTDETVGLGYNHNMKDTYMLLEKIETEYNSHIKMRHAIRTYDITSESSDPTYNNPEPVYLSYSFGDSSMVNPYAFFALDVSEGNEQYATIEYVRDTDARRYSSAVQLVLQYISDDSFSDKMEIVPGDEFNETTAEGSFTRYVKYIVRFGSEITVEELVVALNAYQEESTSVFNAMIHGGSSSTTLLKDVFYYYDGTTLMSTVKVLRFIPPIPSVVINNPEEFFNKYFNTTSSTTHNMNLLAYTTNGDSIPETFINTGIYGFVLRKNYDDAGYQTYPTLVTYDDNPSLVYIPNKKLADHYTKSSAGVPDWFVNGNPVLANNHISSIDLDGNYFFLPFMEVTDSSMRFLSDRTVHIDNVSYADLIDISTTGSYQPALLESRVRFDANDYTLDELEALENIFNQIKMFLGYSASDVLTEDESSLLRVTEFTRGLMWYLNKIVMIDGALTANYPGIKMFMSLNAAYAAGALEKGVTVITITGRSSLGDRTEPVDRSRFTPQVLPVNMQEGMTFVTIEPKDTTLGNTIIDPDFTLVGSEPGDVVYTVASGPASGNTVLQKQDMSYARTVNLCALDTFDETVFKMQGCRFPELHIYRNNVDTDNVNVWETNIIIDMSNDIESLWLDSSANMPFTKLDAGYTDYPVELSGDKAVMEAFLGGPSLGKNGVGRGIKYFYAPEGVGEYDSALYDHPCVLGVTAYTSGVRGIYISAPSLNLCTFEADNRSTVEFRPMSQVFTLSAAGLAVYSDRGYEDNIVRLNEVSYGRFVSDLRFDMELGFVFREFDYGNHPKEQRARSGFRALISVEDVVKNANIEIKIYDEVYDHATYGSNWHCFDPDVFLEAASGNDFADCFLFMDCGVGTQLGFHIVTGGLAPVVVPDNNRTGRFINSDLIISVLNGSSVDDYYSVRFFASRLFRKAPYIFYLADQHPYYAALGMSRKVSEDLRITFATPGTSLTNGVESTIPTSVAVKNFWNVNFGSPGSSYPRVADVTFAGHINSNAFNWIGCKSFIAGMAGGSIRLDDFRFTPVQRQNVIFDPDIHKNSGLAVLEDVKFCDVKIGRLNTTYPVNGILDPGDSTALTDWVETERGIQLLTMSQLNLPALNTGTEVKVGSWVNRCENIGITGGVDLNIDINYTFTTQANDSYILDIGNMIYQTFTPPSHFQFPVKPWFCLAGASGSKISVKHAVSFNAVGVVAPDNSLRTVLNTAKGSKNTPTFYPSTPYGVASGDGVSRLRPMRFLVGGLLKHRGPDDGAQITYLMESNYNEIITHCTRLNLISGFYNTISGFCYWPTNALSLFNITRFLAPDTLWDTHPTFYVNATLNYLRSTCNVMATLAYDRAKNTASETSLAAPRPTIITAPGTPDHNPVHERMELYIDFVGTLNPCDLRAITIKSDTATNGGGKLSLELSPFVPPA